MVLSDLKAGAVIETKKPHACGGAKWQILRTGADRTIKCLSCGRVLVLLPDDLMKRTRRVLEEDK